MTEFVKSPQTGRIVEVPKSALNYLLGRGFTIAEKEKPAPKRRAKKEVKDDV